MPKTVCIAILLLLAMVTPTDLYAKGPKVKTKKRTPAVASVYRDSGSSSATSSSGNRKARLLVKQGNRKFWKKNFGGAEVDYRKALEQNKDNPQALFNLGVAMQIAGEDSLATASYTQAAEVETNPLRRSQCFHNMGTILQKYRSFALAIEMYKQALRLNPRDNDARYNLALCKHQLKNGNDGQNNNDQKDKKEGEKKEQKASEKKQEKQSNQDQQESQPQEQKMSKEAAEQLLNAALQEEKRTQQRLKEAERQAQRRQAEKNW